jgi:hypothetical protein
MAKGKNDGELEELDIAIGMIEDPTEKIKQELRKHQEAMNMHFDDPDAPIAADPNSLGDLPDEFLG